MPCDCDPAKLNAVHLYLKQQFPDYALADFHAPTRLLQAGLPTPHGEHHVVSIARIDVLPYYAVFLGDFLGCPLAEIDECLRRWSVADVLKADRIAVVARDGASAL